MFIRDLDIQLKDPKNKFAWDINRASYSIEGLYLKCIGRNKQYTESIWKVIVNVNDNKSNSKINILGGVAEIDKFFDFDLYFSASKQQKKRILLETLQTGLLDIAQQEKWDINPLLDAYNCCIAKGLNYEKIIKNKYILSPDKKHFAGVNVVCDIDNYTAFIVFLDKKRNEIKREEIIKADPVFDIEVSDMGWDNSNDTFMVKCITSYPEKQNIFKVFLNT